MSFGLTYKTLVGKEAIAALLSFSTKGSSKDKNAMKVVKAMSIIKKKHPKFKVDGEMQLDAAIVPEVAKLKCPKSKVGGKANTLIFPDLDSGNIAYKLVERLAKAEAVGPIIQGLRKPINDLSRGCDVEEIVDLTAITVLQAREEEK